MLSALGGTVCRIGHALTLPDDRTESVRLDQPASTSLVGRANDLLRRSLRSFDVFQPLKVTFDAVPPSCFLRRRIIGACRWVRHRHQVLIMKVGSAEEIDVRSIVYSFGPASLRFRVCAYGHLMEESSLGSTIATFLQPLTRDELRSDAGWKTREFLNPLERYTAPPRVCQSGALPEVK